MANTDDIDEILDGLSYEDLQALSEEIDPEVCFDVKLLNKTFLTLFPGRRTQARNVSSPLILFQQFTNLNFSFFW